MLRDPMFTGLKIQTKQPPPIPQRTLSSSLGKSLGNNSTAVVDAQGNVLQEPQFELQGEANATKLANTIAGATSPLYHLTDHQRSMLLWKRCGQRPCWDHSRLPDRPC